MQEQQEPASEKLSRFVLGLLKGWVGVSIAAVSLLCCAGCVIALATTGTLGVVFADIGRLLSQGDEPSPTSPVVYVTEADRPSATEAPITPALVQPVQPATATFTPVAYPHLSTIPPAEGTWLFTPIPLYQVSLNIPEGWTVAETNRRPEPTGDDLVPVGHECADYLVASGGGDRILSFEMPCGYIDQGAVCPSVLVYIGMYEEDYIARYPDFPNGRYVYTRARFDPNGPQGLFCWAWSDAVISYRGDGEISQWDLTVPDLIVLSYWEFSIAEETMPTYKVSRWSADEKPELLETRDVDALNVNDACKLLGWGLGSCSFQYISDDLDRWNGAKNRIIRSCEKVPAIADLLWKDIDQILDGASRMSDVELADALASRAEQLAGMLKPRGEPTSDIEMSLTDTALLWAFFTWRTMPTPKYILTHCQYCEQEGEMVRWEVPLQKAIEQDKRPFAYVCLTGAICLQKAIEDGYVAISGHRRRYVEVLSKQGKTRPQLQEILHVGRSTIDKDIRILELEGKM